jgi:protein TonB
MFETVVPETVAKKSKRIFYETLPVSLALHGIVIAGLVGGALWNVSFPSESPRLVRAYQIASLPEPPPPPPPPAPPKALQQQPIQHLTQVVPVQEEVAPTFIPDEIPVVTTLPIVAQLKGAVAEGVEGGIEGGVVGGMLDGIQGGEVGGTKGGTIGGIITDNRVHIERDKPLPLFPVSQVYPQYPEDARLRNWEDSLVVRYVIGMDGRVKEVTVISSPERKLFADAAVRAIKNWRFRPYMKDGAPQEVVHELTIYFKLS